MSGHKIHMYFRMWSNIWVRKVYVSCKRVVPKGIERKGLEVVGVFQVE